MVDVGAAFPAFGESSELVQEGEGLFHYPAHRLVVPGPVMGSPGAHRRFVAHGPGVHRADQGHPPTGRC